MRFKERLYRFMQGRYGTDELSKFLSGAGLGLLIIALVFTVISSALSANHPVGSTVFFILYWITYAFGLGIFIFSIFRSFSRKIYKRQAENTRFLYRMNKLKRTVAGLKDRWKNRKTYRYIKCPKCKQMLRVPKNKGKIRVTCSSCDEKFIIKT